MSRIGSWSGGWNRGPWKYTVDRGAPTLGRVGANGGGTIEAPVGHGTVLAVEEGEINDLGELEHALGHVAGEVRPAHSSTR